MNITKEEIRVIKKCFVFDNNKDKIKYIDQINKGEIVDYKHIYYTWDILGMYKAKLNTIEFDVADELYKKLMDIVLQMLQRHSTHNMEVT